MTLARLVAEKVMGWTWHDDKDCHYVTTGGTRIYEDAWWPHTDMNDAWRVEGRLYELDWCVTIDRLSDGPYAVETIDLSGWEGKRPTTYHRLAPTAICLAALRALNVELPAEYR